MRGRVTSTRDALLMPSDNEHFTDDGASDVEPAETGGTRTPPKKSAERAEHDAPADAATSHQFTWSQSAEEITLEMPVGEACTVHD